MARSERPSGQDSNDDSNGAWLLAQLRVTRRELRNLVVEAQAAERRLYARVFDAFVEARSAALKCAGEMLCREMSRSELGAELHDAHKAYRLLYSQQGELTALTNALEQAIARPVELAGSQAAARMAGLKRALNMAKIQLASVRSQKQESIRAFLRAFMIVEAKRDGRVPDAVSAVWDAAATANGDFASAARELGREQLNRVKEMHSRLVSMADVYGQLAGEVHR